MDDREGKDPQSGFLKKALGQVRKKSAESLQDVRRSVGRAADRLAKTEAAQKLGEEVEARRLLRKAADAQRRGNHAMAFRLLEPEVTAKPDDEKVVVGFWQAALACERSLEAVDPMLRVIRRLAASGKPERAAELWLELREAVPTALVAPGTLVRMVPALEAAGRIESVVVALREAVDARNRGLTPGLAVRVAEVASALDPPTARRAAELALASPGLHESKRARLEQLVAGLAQGEPEAADEEPASEPHEGVDPDPAAEPARPLDAAPGTDPAAVGRALDEAVDGAVGAELDEAVEGALGGVMDALAPAARFREAKVTTGMPTGLVDEGVTLQILGGRKARVDWAKIEAVAVGEVRGLSAHPVWVIDLVLNWSAQDDAALRVVRFQSDGFDPRMVIDAPEDPTDALRRFLAELLERSNAVPLPDSDAALGVRVRSFDDLAGYESGVLQIAR